MRKALGVFLCLGTLVTVVYPCVVTGIGLVFFKEKALGSLVARDGKRVGSLLIAQPFTSPSYFWPRPSHAGARGFDGTRSGASHSSQTQESYGNLLKERRNAFSTAHPHVPPDAIPPDALMASGSGLDPHISFKNALIQAQRVAKARGQTPEDIFTLLEQSKIHPLIPIAYEPYVNVLQVNLALDEAFPM